MAPFVFNRGGHPRNFSAGRNAQVTFTAETWTHIQDVMDRQYPDLRILGWYHTHPGHGIFLSDMDLFIHKNFFSLPWHLAFVFDPQHLEEGLFAWRAGNMVVESFVVQKDVQPDTTKVARRVPEMPPAPIVNPGVPQELMPPSETPASFAPLQQALQATASQAAYPAAAMEIKDLTARLQSLEKRQRWTNAAIALLVLIAVAWPIALAALAVMHPGSIPSIPWLTSGSAAQEPPNNATE